MRAAGGDVRAMVREALRRLAMRPRRPIYRRVGFWTAVAIVLYLAGLLLFRLR